MNVQVQILNNIAEIHVCKRLNIFSYKTGPEAQHQYSFFCHAHVVKASLNWPLSTQ